MAASMTYPVCPIHDERIHDELEGCDHCKADAELEAAEHAELNDDVVDVEIIWEVTEPGWWPDMPEDIYHADPVPAGSLSASMTKLLIQPGGPAKLRQQLDTPQEPKKEYDLGQAAHKLVLGVGAEIARIPETLLASNGATSTRAAKEFIANARRDGRIPLKPAEYDQVHNMATELAAHPTAAQLLANTAPEVSAFRQHDSGIWLRSRIDAVGDSYLIDYKTARTADPDLFRRDAATLGYHIQDAFYSAMADALDGLPNDPDFYFIVQEKEPPYLVSVVELSPTFRAIGAAAVEHAITLWDQCTTTGEWPGYPGGIHLIDPPAWIRSHNEGDGQALDAGPMAELDPAFEAQLALLAGIES